MAVIAAFAPMVVNASVVAQAKADGEGAVARVASYLSVNGRRIHFPALVLVGFLGLGLVFSSDPGSGETIFAFDQNWVSLAVLVWLALCGSVAGLILPGERKLAAGDLAAERQVALGGQITTVLFLVMLYLMIWKPGL